MVLTDVFSLGKTAIPFFFQQRDNVFKMESLILRHTVFIGHQLIITPSMPIVLDSTSMERIAKVVVVALVTLYVLYKVNKKEYFI